MKIVVDMNLSPTWIPLLQEGGHEAIHWSKIGRADAPDTEIMAWARDRGFMVFTHDLDYGALLHATSATAPSVLQVRTEDIRLTSIGDLVLTSLKTAEKELSQGALVTLDPKKMRLSSLPMKTGRKIQPGKP
jgi:predicted nuclease of predicted toxin-antitoxin system